MNDIFSPGHRAVFVRDGQNDILYHRHSVSFDPKFVGRQVCVDELKFTADGLIEKVIPTHEGLALVQRRGLGWSNLAVVATASSERDEFNRANCVLDGNFTTHWSSAFDALGGWLQVDLGTVKSFAWL